MEENNELKLPENNSSPELTRIEEVKDNCHCQKIIFDKNRLMALVLALVFISALVGAVFGFMGGSLANGFNPSLQKFFNSTFKKNGGTSGNDASKNTVVEEESSTISVVEKSSPSVVSIVISKDVPKYRSMFNDPFGFFDPFGGSNNPNNPDNNSSGGSSTEKQKIGGGTGFFVSDSGMVVTNRHVVSDATADYTVITNDGKEHTATVLARDPVRDIAVIKIDGSGYPVMNLGDSDNLKIGQTVIAIGNSLGEFSNSVSKGIISGLKRKVTAGSSFGGDEETLSGIIQTDAAINPGNSGGPLLDINGDAIGVNVAMAQGAQNVGFALPINQVKKIIDQVKTQGKISTPYIGIRYVIVDDTIQKDNNLPFNYGALVVRGQRMTDLAVIPGSPADKAGIVENDIILNINGDKITADNQLADEVAKFNVGDVVTASVWHKGETKDYKITLEERK
jgi:serine protease Do